MKMRTLKIGGMHMQNLILKMIVVFSILFTLYQYRYKVLNYVLGFSFFRKLAVKTSMSFPAIREKFIQSAFR